jgi:hypothetical protein
MTTKTKRRHRQPTSEQRIKWLLDFLRQDLTTMKPRALFAVRDGAIRHLHNADDELLDDATRDMRAFFGPMAWGAHHPVPDAADDARFYLGALQARLLKGAAVIAAGRHWPPFDQYEPAPDWTFHQAPDGTVARIYTGFASGITLAHAADLLAGWWPQLRRCKHCKALFLPRHGRQVHHDIRCERQATYERRKPNRDYVKEEERRAELELARKRKGRK